MTPAASLDGMFRSSRTAPFPTLVLVSRPLLFVAAYFVMVGVFWPQYGREAFAVARPWWAVGGVVVNLISLAVLAEAARNEGRSLESLIGIERAKTGRELLTLLWAIPLSMVLAVGANVGLRFAIWGWDAAPVALMSLDALPDWALLVSVMVFPLLNAVTEQLTYNGYCLSHAEDGLRSPAAAVVVVTAVFALQHVAVPFAFDLKFLLWRVGSFVPLLLFWVLLYRSTRRLTALIPTHWLMDVVGVASLLFIAA